MGSEDAAPPEFAGFCKCLYNICSELQNLVSIAKVSAPLVLYVGHDTLSGVKVFNEPVRRNQIVEGKFTSVRMWMKEVQDEVWRTRTGNGYKALMRVSLHYKTKPKS